MKSNELRIGNYVNRLGRLTTILAVQEADGIGYVSTPLSGTVTINQIEPIALSEDWLIKAGFIKPEYSSIVEYHYGDIELYFLTKDECYQFEHKKIVIDLYYVHQLQNLVHSLTGEELEFKL